MTLVTTDLPPQTVGFSVFRTLPDGRGRQYSTAEFTRGWAGAEHFLRQIRICGACEGVASVPAYALLDAVDADGETVHTYDLPTAEAFRYAYRKLKLRVVYTDGDPLPRTASSWRTTRGSGPGCPSRATPQRRPGCG